MEVLLSLEHLPYLEVQLSKIETTGRAVLTNSNWQNVTVTNTYSLGNEPIDFSVSKKWATNNGTEIQAPAGAYVEFTLYRIVGNEGSPVAVTDPGPITLDGTADEKQNLNYQNTALAPILTAITEEYQRKFLSDTAVTQGQAIRYFKDPFKLVPVDNLAEIADKFTRNEIMTKNEFRSILGMKPSDDPKADQLVNSNLNQNNNETQEEPPMDEGNPFEQNFN